MADGALQAGADAPPAPAPAVPGSEDPFAARLRGFGPVGLLAVLVVLAGNLVVAPLSAVLALAWARRSRTPWRALGLEPPASWPRTIALGVAFGAALKLLMKAAVMPLLGADPVNRPYHYLAGNTAQVPAMVFAAVVTAGLGEEILFRGYLFERLGALLGRSAGAKVVTVVLTAALFGWGHYAVQGVPGVEQATITGLVFGAIFAATGRIWLLVCAHAAFDLTAFAIIYWNVETRVAHLVFK